MGDSRKPYVESLESKLNLPPNPPLGVKLGHKIADFDMLPDIRSDLPLTNFVFLPYVSFITAFTALECIKRLIGKPYVKSLDGWSDVPPDPPTRHPLIYTDNISWSLFTTEVYN